MFPEPQAVTISGAAKSLPRVAFGDRRGVFNNAADGVQLSITHVTGKRNSSTVRLDITKTAADPLLDGVSKQYSMSAFLTINTPPVGFSATEIAANMKALNDWAAVAGNLSKVVGGES